VCGGTPAQQKEDGRTHDREPAHGTLDSERPPVHVITIPAKTPHWLKEVPSQTIAYYAVNTEP